MLGTFGLISIKYADTGVSIHSTSLHVDNDIPLVNKTVDDTLSEIIANDAVVETVLDHLVSVSETDLDVTLLVLVAKALVVVVASPAGMVNSDLVVNKLY